MTNPLLFLIATLLLLGAPGPTNAMLWICGAESGIRRALPLVLGALAGYLSAITVIILTLQQLLSIVPWIADLLGVAVAVYIAVLAVKVWRQPEPTRGGVALISLSKVFVVTLLNPKAFVLASSILPLGHPQIASYFVALSVSILAAGAGWVVLGAVAGATAGARNAVWLKRVSSVVLGGFSGLILLNVLL